MAEKPTIKTIEEYISLQETGIQPLLTEMRNAILSAAPKAQERMSWQMPTFHYKENLVHFAVHKNHIGFYPGTEAIICFQEQLKEYKTSKGAVQFPLSKPIPYELVSEITKYRVNTVEKQ